MGSPQRQNFSINSLLLSNSYCCFAHLHAKSYLWEKLIIVCLYNDKHFYLLL